MTQHLLMGLFTLPLHNFDTEILQLLYFNVSKI
jgi:hypothetical protein